MHQFCFYLDWAGISPEAWAAWAQVAVAILIGLSAIYIPIAFSGIERSRRIRTVLSLAGLTAGKYLQASGALGEGPINTETILLHLREGRDILAALESIPTPDLIAWEVIHIRVTLAARCKNLEQLLSEGLKFGFSNYADLPDKIAEDTNLIISTIEEITFVSRKSLTWWDRYRMNKSLV